jgi:DNA/RNA endonuclease G (NUC1)
MALPDSMTAPPVLADVFVSYARADVAIVAAMVNSLRDEGFTVWFDESIYAGAEWETLLLGTLSAAKAVLVVWSRHSITRPWVLREAQLARAAGRLVPIRIDDCDIPPEFEDIQVADMTGWDGHSNPRLAPLLVGLAKLAPPSRIDTVRPGYDSNFLGVEVDLPTINGVGEEFPYLHFSVVMNPARRLAWYVAYNVGTRVNVERANRSMPDPMIPEAFQPQDVHFKLTGFDRGHLVSPASVSWGDMRLAQIANRQSFFWTNTAPMLPELSRHLWTVIGEWERAFARDGQRVIGLAGPVLRDDDPVHGAEEVRIGRLRSRQNFRLPRKYWKVVAISNLIEVRIAAFLWDEQERPPALGQHSLKAWRVEINSIEAETGLEFSETLRSAREIGSPH